MSQPRATMLLITYNQEDYILDALQAAAAQDYVNLEIVVSDDASTDTTFAKVKEFVSAYHGLHHFILNRNDVNIGIGANLSKAVSLSSGEIFFITAGDDISLPQRVSTVMQFWLECEQKPDLIACNLLDMLTTGEVVGEIKIADLSLYQSLDDWAKHPPHVIGAAQAWTRRLFDRFGGIPAGVVGEDMVMAFRAIAIGSAVTLPVPLIKYRRGGLTTQKKLLTVAAVIKGLTRKVKSSQIELLSMLDTATTCNGSSLVQDILRKRLYREQYIEAMFYGKRRVVSFFCFSGVSLGFKIRVAAYALFPWALMPFFFFKRKVRNIRNS